MIYFDIPLKVFREHKAEIEEWLARPPIAVKDGQAWYEVFSITLDDDLSVDLRHYVTPDDADGYVGGEHDIDDLEMDRYAGEIKVNISQYL